MLEKNMLEKSLSKKLQSFEDLWRPRGSYLEPEIHMKMYYYRIFYYFGNINALFKSKNILALYLDDPPPSLPIVKG